MKLLLKKSNNGNPKLYIRVPQNHKLLIKSGQHRDPSLGQFIGGKRASAHSKEGQTDLTSFVASLMDTLPGEELKKE